MKISPRHHPSQRPHYVIELNFQQVLARCTRLLNESPNPMIIQKPVIHLNGSGQESLRTEYRNCLLRIEIASKHLPADQGEMAIHALMQAAENVLDFLPHPNGRDYYPDGPEALTIALNQRNFHAAKLREVYKEGEALFNLDALDGQLPAKFPALLEKCEATLAEVKAYVDAIADHIDYPCGWEICPSCEARISHDRTRHGEAFRRHAPGCTVAPENP